MINKLLMIIYIFYRRITEVKLSYKIIDHKIQPILTFAKRNSKYKNYLIELFFYRKKCYLTFKVS